MMTSLRELPSVDRVVLLAEQQAVDLPRPLLVEQARRAIEQARQALIGGRAAPALHELVAATLAAARTRTQPSLVPVINASGVIIQTNLGRAPLSRAALDAMQRVGTGYSNLEYNLDAGERGSRSVHLNELLCRLTGAEAALAVNNNAAAIYLVLIALANGREVIVSRGQAVEIGGGFRIPDVLRQSGATLVEVGTTNRTYAHDYTRAINERTALVLRVHTSNFRLMGFVHETPLHELANAAHTHGIPILDDLGSGTLLPTAPYGLTPEPTVQESVAAGADLVTFSGDKLLGGPQAGLIVGRADLIAGLKQHPLARALRVDKTTIAGLEATLLSYVCGRAVQELPVWRMITATLDSLQQRAERLQARIKDAEIVACESAVGGGSLPGDTLPSRGVTLPGVSPDRLSECLRRGTPAVVGRILDDQLVLDIRTIAEDEEEALIAAVQRAMEEA